MARTLVPAAAGRLSIPQMVPPGPLMVILLLQGIVSTSLRNTAFQDEALYLYAGRQIFSMLMGGPPVVDVYERYFSGLPYLYPVLAGVLDSVGGLEFARAFSLGCMLFATSAVYIIALHLIERSSAFFAAALFAFQGPVLLLGRLATHDAMCLALLALATVLAAYTNRKRWLLAALLLGPILLLAVATKYAGLLFVPAVLAVMGVQTWRVVDLWHALLRVLVPIIVMVAVATVLLMLSESAQDILLGLRSTTLERVATFRTDHSVPAITAAKECGILIMLGLLGLLLDGRRRTLLGLVLISTALLAPAYHIYKTELISIHKHMAFGLFFVAPLAGFATTRISGYEHGKTIGPRWLAGFAIFLLTFTVGFGQAQEFYDEWPNSDELTRVLRSQDRPGGGHILAEEAEVPRYYLQDSVAVWQWSGLYWFQYTDKEGRELQGEEAYKAAIADSYFDLVVLRYGPCAATAYAISDGLKNGEKYEQIAQIPYSTTFGAGDYWIWRRR